MSVPRLALVLASALGLPLLTGACGAPLAVGAASYGTDGASMVGTGKSTTDHLASMVSKRDCALWRVFRNQSVCRDRDPGSDPNPYKVDYTTPERDISNGEPEYREPLRAPASAPPVSWSAATYAQPASQEAAKPAVDQPATTPPTVTAEVTPAPSPAATATPAPAKAKKKSAAGRSAKKVKPKPASKPASPDPAASAL